MFVITGATGQVGSHIAKYLLEKKQPVRIIVRNPDKAKQLAELGATVHLGDIDNPSDIQAGFAGADVVFLLDPPAYHEPNVEEITRQRLDTLKAAIVQKGVKRVVALTSGGVHQRDIDIGNLRYAQIWEDRLKDLNVPVSSLRPAWFMENWLPAIGMAQQNGQFPSLLRNLDRPIPQIAARDIAKIAAEVMLSTWKGFQVLELEGPQRYSANDVANTLSKHLGKDVHPSIITREALPSMLLSINTHPNSIDGWVTMLDFTNGDKAPFEHEEAAVKGTTTLDIFISLAIEDSN
jgi:NAD(P)H dehydrogenase (quinone)